jgi:hypothetical protein
MSDAQVKTITKEVSVSCPKGYWCSAGLTVACTKGTYNDLSDQNNAGACKLCPQNSISEPAATSASECKCGARYFAAILPLRDENKVERGPDCQLCPDPGSNCTQTGNTVFTLPLATNYWRV